MCLDSAGGKLLHTLEKACLMTMACCTLHVVMRRGEPLPDGIPPMEDIPEDPADAPNEDGLIIRQQLIARL